MNLQRIALACTAVVTASAAAQDADNPDQARIDWLGSSAIRINSIDPDHVDFADLQPLKAAIGDARVVQLGEQSHGDGAVFLAKCRLVKFLHQEMGFDVLVWEGGVYDGREVDRTLRKPGAPIDDAAADAWKNGIFGIWTLSAQAKPVLEYARASAARNRPLETAGYDCQFSSGDAGRWLDAIGDFLKPLGEKHPAHRIIAAIRTSRGVLEGNADSMAQAEGVMQGLDNLSALIDAARPRLEEAHGPDEFVFLRRTIDDARATAHAALVHLQRRADPTITLNPRDQRMGENLIWLANEHYKGRKLIVWAATMHEVHDVQAIRPTFNPELYKGAITAGTVAKRTLGDNLYTIGFDAHEGAAGICFGRPGPIEPSPPGSLGNLLSRLDHPFLYIDFRTLPENHWLREPIIARPLGYAPMDTDWTRQLDAIFFIRTMFPSTQTGRAPEGALLTVDPQ